MAYKKSGTVSNDPVGIQDPRFITLSAGAAAAKAVFTSDDAVGTEFQITAPANDTKFASRAGCDRISLGKNPKVTITGDGDTFLRVDD